VRSHGSDPAGRGPRYALLLAPSANRVYARHAPDLIRSELAAFGAVLSIDPEAVATLTIGEVPYVGFGAARPLSERDLDHLSRVSGGYALFEVVPGPDGGELLRPLPLGRPGRYDDDLVTIPKYAGKTNEQFTQLLLNLTVLASARAVESLDRPLVVLDPLCGRGTTLNQALRYGYHAMGIESDASQVEAYGAFLRTWLRRKRLKHTVAVNPVRRERRRVARRLEATLAPTRDDYQQGRVQRVTVLQADTVTARELLRAGCCDVIVTDTPYGVAHGARVADQRSRSPRELLAAALPGWVELLRDGGALGLSFNTHVLPRDQVEALLSGVGLAVVTAPGYTDLSHWVDQGITRDVVVARRG
jgi:SAM-dependent methyltransferase